MFYGNAFEAFASSVDVLAYLNNLTMGRAFNKFQSISWKGYLKLSKASRFNSFSKNEPFTALCAWLAVRRFKGGWFLDQMATIPLIFPAIVMGVAFLQVFLNLPFALYGTLLSVVIASVVREMPYGMRYSYAGLLQIHTELEEASAVSGAGQVGTFLRIVMPLVAPAMITCWLFLFLIAVRAVSMPILLVGPNSQVVAVTLFDLWENGQVTELAAMGMAWMALMTVVSAIFYIIARRYRLTLH